MNFRREKDMPVMGPDGGNGGRGGSIYFIGNRNTKNLSHISKKFYDPDLHQEATKYKNKNYNFGNKVRDNEKLLAPKNQIRAGNAGHGNTNHKTGKTGKDTFIELPLGTVIYDIDTQQFVALVSKHDQIITAANGGFGGLGNYHFQSPETTTPAFAIPANEMRPPDDRNYALQMMQISHVNVFGCFGSGKSSLVQYLTDLQSVKETIIKEKAVPLTTVQRSYSKIKGEQLTKTSNLNQSSNPNLLKGEFSEGPSKNSLTQSLDPNEIYKTQHAYDYPSRSQKHNAGNRSEHKNKHNNAYLQMINEFSDYSGYQNFPLIGVYKNLMKLGLNITIADFPDFHSEDRSIKKLYQKYSVFSYINYILLDVSNEKNNNNSELPTTQLEKILANLPEIGQKKSRILINKFDNDCDVSRGNLEDVLNFRNRRYPNLEIWTLPYDLEKVENEIEETFLSLVQSRSGRAEKGRFRPRIQSSR